MYTLFKINEAEVSNDILENVVLQVDTFIIAYCLDIEVVWKA